MQTEAEAFLQRIRAYPDDDAQRLILADWLDEEGDPRGRFIRVQLALAELPPDATARRDLQIQERELLTAHRDAWLAPFRGLATGCEFRRGFVDELKVEARQFLRHADTIFAAAPVRHVHLLDVSESLPAVMQVPYLGRLAALTVHAQHTGEPLARAVARSEHLAGLKRLTLTRNRLGDDAAEQLARSPHLTNLEELDLSENEIGEAGARALAASSHLGKVCRLELRDNRFGPVGAEAVAGSDRLASLYRLGLAHNDVGLPRLLSLGRACALLGVPVLDLCANGLKAAALQTIFTRPQGPDAGPVRLTELDLGHNKELGDDGARVLAGCPHLEELAALRLADCGIGDEGCRALANAPHLNRVEVLDLESNSISDAGLRPFLDTRYWRALRHLGLPRGGLSIGLRKDIDSKFNRPRRA
ncbi:MAG: TIGR02996 domain-containing protein [Planctomycetes bacterium]|nr:TIGR02996 domain-containing protein [Planctomycetota bacterium]